MPDDMYATKDSLDRLEARYTEQVRDIYNRLNENTESIVKLETWYNTLVKLPDAIAALEKTVVSVNHNLEAMSTRINQVNESIAEQKHSINELRAENQKQNETISEVDNKSKVDWQKAISDNWWKIILVVGTIVVACQQLIG